MAEERFHHKYTISQPKAFSTIPQSRLFNPKNLPGCASCGEVVNYDLRRTHSRKPQFLASVTTRRNNSFPILKQVSPDFQDPFTPIHCVCFYLPLSLPALDPWLCLDICLCQTPMVQLLDKIQDTQLNVKFLC